MPVRRPHVTASAAQSELAAALAGLRTRLELPGEFSAAALAEAEAARAETPGLDLRDLPFATLDPLGSLDLDQAFHLESRGSGYTVRYAIADVPAFVAPGGALDAEARERGQTFYAADGTIPLHPRILSEDHASLLPGVERPAFVWTFALDEAGTVTDTRVERALIRSRARLDYASEQAAVDSGSSEFASLLPAIGGLRLAQEAARGGASLNLPDEEIERDADGAYRIVRRRTLPIEEWNAQLSLMTGMAAAQLMLGAKVGILRTMPQPDDAAFEAFRLRTRALGVPWTQGRYGDYLRLLPREDPSTLPILTAAASLFRGAGYASFDGEVPEQTVQSAIAAPYAHATAPLRRLVDRWALVICHAVSTGAPVPSWIRESLPALPDLMRESNRRAARLNTATLDCAEAALLTPHIGETFTGAVVERSDSGERGVVQIADPAVTASVPLPAEARPGSSVRLVLEATDIAKGSVVFRAA